MNETKVSHHLLLCATAAKAKCCDPVLGHAAWTELKNVIQELGLESDKRSEGIVLRSKVDCLRICERGPILVIWPDGIWYADVTAEKVRTIIEKHILAQQPIEEWILKRTPFHQGTS